MSEEFEAKYDKYDIVILNTILYTYFRIGEKENVMRIMRKMDEITMHRKGHQPMEVCLLFIYT